MILAENATRRKRSSQTKNGAKMGVMGKTGGLSASAKGGAATRPFRAKIRLATRADAAELQAIYAYYVENTTVSFEYEAPSVAEMERRIAAVEGVYPFLVCVVEGENGERIVGYALAHRAFEREAYSWTAETSVYVDRNWRRSGIGEALYSALIEILEAQGTRALYAVVVAENKASVEFHCRAGYREFATFKNSGWKFDRWLDVVWLERTLGVWRDDETLEEKEKGGAAPTPVRPLADLAPERLAAICDAARKKLALRSNALR